jgi:hypothetical protein
MDEQEKKFRMQLFLKIAEQVSGRDTIDELYEIAGLYDLPTTCDRDFVYDCMIEYYQRLEEYERCATLLGYKSDIDRQKEPDFSNLTDKELIKLNILGFNVPLPKKLPWV